MHVYDYAQELLYMDQRIFPTKLWEFIPHIGHKLAFITQHVTGVYIEMLVKERPVLLSSIYIRACFWFSLETKINYKHSRDIRFFDIKIFRVNIKNLRMVSSKISK